jgi:hypothetical protein
MKRKPSEDKAPSGATPGSEPSPAETPDKAPKEGAREMGNQHAQGQWWDPVSQSPRGSKEDQASLPGRLEAMSEEELNRLSPGLTEVRALGGGMLQLGDGIEVSIERLDRYALAFQALYPDKDWVEEIIPLAVRRIYQMSELLSGGAYPAEFEFMAAHARRWKPGDGISLKADVLIFDPAFAKESCKAFRERLKGTALPFQDGALERRIYECHEIYLERREELGQGRRFPPSGKPGGVMGTFYPGFEGPVFIGKEIEGLARYMNIRSVKARSARRAKQLFLAGAKK